MKKWLFLILATLSLAAGAEESVATLRGHIPLDAEHHQPPQLRDPENKDIKRPRNYPMQPPTIPHQITQYQIDLNANKCLSCHARTRTGESQAPMVSVTHFMDRDGNFLADVSPRRYFCTQCHVPQIAVKTDVNNQFIDMHQLHKKP